MKIFIFFSTVLSFLCSTIIRGQFVITNKKDAKIVKNCILEVVLSEEDEKQVSALKGKPEELQAYRAGIDTFNIYLKDNINRIWRYSDKIKFITQVEYKELRKNKTPNICFLKTVQIKNHKMGNFYSAGSNSGFNSSGDLAYYLSPVSYSNALSVAWAPKPNINLVYTFYPMVDFSHGSLIFMIQNLQNQLENAYSLGVDKISKLKKVVKKDAPLLKEKTLLILDDMMSKGLKKSIEKGELEKYYPYKYEVVNFNQLEKHIIDRDDKYAYIWIIPAGLSNHGKIYFNYFIVDASDGKFLYMTGLAVLGANGQFHQAQLLLANRKIK